MEERSGNLLNFEVPIMRFEILSAVNMLMMMMAVFWDVAPCSLVDVYRRFRGKLPDYTAQHSRRQVIFILAAVRT
jgi:hypothetical protein